jgi:hypothetical protein
VNREEQQQEAPCRGGAEAEALEEVGGGRPEAEAPEEVGGGRPEEVVNGRGGRP